MSNVAGFHCNTNNTILSLKIGKAISEGKRIRFIFIREGIRFSSQLGKHPWQQVEKAEPLITFGTYATNLAIELTPTKVTKNFVVFKDAEIILPDLISKIYPNYKSVLYNNYKPCQQKRLSLNKIKELEVLG